MSRKRLCPHPSRLAEDDEHLRMTALNSTENAQFANNIGSGTRVKNCNNRMAPRTSVPARLPRNGRLDLLGPGRRIVAAIWRRRSDGKIRCDYRTVQCVR